VSGKDTDGAELQKREVEVRGRIASRLEELRQKEDVTLRFLGDAAQLGHAHISQLLLGKVNVTMNTLVKLAYALDVDVADFLKKGPVTKPKQKRGRPKIRRVVKS
jgi:transcriptional regulator with XRE-family HTH domain